MRNREIGFGLDKPPESMPEDFQLDGGDSISSPIGKLSGEKVLLFQF